MFNIIQKIKDWWRGYPVFGGTARSSEWPKCKKNFEKIHPKKCAVCEDKRVQLHHKQSFHTHPELELVESNLCWLCEGLGTLQHHRGVGHLGNFQSINEKIEEDIPVWHTKIMNRPKWDGKEWLYPDR